MPDRPAILQVSTTDVGGGAARVAWDLFQAYRARGYPSWLAVGRSRTEAPGVIAIPNEESRGPWARGWRGLAHQLQRAETMPGVTRIGRVFELLGEPARHLARGRGREDFDFPGTTRMLPLVPRRPDVLHAHNLHGRYFDLRALPELSRQVPTLLTLHDAWLLSGHCAHSLACERWKTGCGACPDLSLYPAVARDATAYNWNRKRDIYRHSRLYVATPSRWLMAKVEQSILAPAVREARIVPNGVDLHHFHPGDRREARDELGLPRDAAILLATGTRMIHNEWKDYPTLTEAVRIVADNARGKQVILLVLGAAGPEEAAGNARVRFIPYQNDPSTVGRHYQAADVYVHAARADTFPSAVLEALACGTPVVATAVGGIVEQVVDGETGFLVPAVDPRALAARTTQLLLDRTLSHRFAMQAAQAARERFSLDTQVDAYLRWYEALAEPSNGILAG